MWSNPPLKPPSAITTTAGGHDDRRLFYAATSPLRTRSLPWSFSNRQDRCTFAPPLTLGDVYGVELTTSYTNGEFSAYANLADSVAKGENWSSAQFLFNPSDLAYVRSHWIYLDHDQKVTGSIGTAYLWDEKHGGTRIYADALYGTGLRTDATAADGANIPNGGSVPAYWTLNLGGEQTFRFGGGHAVKVRIDVVNLTDKSYELRDGTGVGVNAAQYGMRRGVFGSLRYEF